MEEEVQFLKSYTDVLTIVTDYLARKKNERSIFNLSKKWMYKKCGKQINPKHESYERLLRHIKNVQQIFYSFFI